MALLQGSGAISLNDIRNLFGGSAILSQYYLNGGLVPSSKTVGYTAQDGPSFALTSPSTYWHADINASGTVDIYWANSLIGSGIAPGATSYTSGAYTYYRGAFVQRVTSSQSDGPNWVDDFYQVYRQYPSSYSAAINGGIPTSGAISLSQFYSAEKP